MHPVKIKQKPEHYLVLEQVLHMGQTPNTTTRIGKAAAAILQKVLVRVAKKAIEARMSPNDKPKSLELAYYEADALERHLRINRGLFRAGTYEYNAVVSIAAELDQKLQ
jgi:hypothetical protein|tara:strand:+ start:8869 stop:9195 length:327 start_codon:yes stop_codon:yes gene_type:complete